MQIGVLGIGAYVPDRVMTNDDWARYVDTSDEWITTRTGIKTRRIAADDQSTVDLAVAAAERALADAGITAAELDEIVVASDTPEALSPDTASWVQDRLGAREIPAYDIGGSGCAGGILALDIARSRAAGGKTILVIAVEVITRIMDWTERETCVLFGDAAAALVVGTGESPVEMVAFTAGTDGTQAEILGRVVGGTKTPVTAELVEQREHLKITMNGREVFRHAVKRMTQATVEVLAKARLRLEDVALVIPHQANMRILEAVRKAVDLPGEKLYSNIEKYGNTGSASVHLALAEARAEGRIEPGDLVLLTAFGAGFHWAAMLLRF